MANVTFNRQKNIPLDSQLLPIQNIPLDSQVLPIQNIPLDSQVLPIQNIPLDSQVLPIQNIPLDSQVLPIQNIPLDSQVLPIQNITPKQPGTTNPEQGYNMSNTTTGKSLTIYHQNIRSSMSKKEELHIYMQDM